MTMAAMTFTPDEFEVGVNIFGVTNWIRTLKSIPIFWEAKIKRPEKRQQEGPLTQ